MHGSTKCSAHLGRVGRPTLFDDATLASLYPANATYRKEYATALAWVADAQRAEGRYDDAIAAREKQIATLEQLASATADSIQSSLRPA